MVLNEIPTVLIRLLMLLNIIETLITRFQMLLNIIPTLITRLQIILIVIPTLITMGVRAQNNLGGAPNFCPKNLSLQLNFAPKNFQHIIYGNGIKITNFGPQMLTAKKSIY